MSQDSQLVGQSIEEMLVGLAEGVREAQAALDALPALDAWGRPSVRYHLPYLDFQLQAEVETQTAPAGGRPIVRLFGARTRGTAQTASTQSSVSGRLVAVPASEGLPLPQLQLVIEQPDLAQPTFRLRILLGNSAGEVMADQRVELNLDVSRSQDLSKAAGVSLSALRAGTGLQAAVLTTDENGRASTLLALDPAEPTGAQIVVVASYAAVRVQGVVRR